MSEDFGSYLKHERELRGISLENVAQATKINIRFLQALEESRYDDLPGEVFIRGFIRAYGKVIGSNADELLAAYHESIGKRNGEQSPETPTAPADTAPDSPREPFPFPIKAVLGFVAALLFIVGGIYWFSSGKGTQKVADLQSPEISVPAEADTGPPEAGVETESPAAEESPAPTSEGPPANSEPTPPEADKPTAPPSEPPENGSKAGQPGKTVTDKNTVTVAEKDAIMKDLQDQSVSKSEEGSEQSPPEVPGLTLVIRVTENSWFNLTVDKQRDQDFILPEGGTKTIQAETSIVMTIGNRRATLLTLNNQPLDLPESPDNVIRNFIVNAERLD